MTDESGQQPTSRLRLWLAFAVVNAIIVIVILALAEGLFVLLLNHPPAIGVIRRALQGYYANFDRAIVQYLPDCAQYDAELGYTLRPGSCRFATRDFDTTLHINSKGVRDDESSLAGPRIIVVGDSYTMGWGVEEAEAYPTLLEKACGVTVLNAGISSYGTAREVGLLKRLDRSRLEWLVVQYSDNDLRENQEFRAHGNRVIAMSPDEYRTYQAEVASRARYYPGKHLFQFIPDAGRRVLGRVSPPAPGADAPAKASGDSEASLFLNALSDASIPDNVKILVFELNGASRNDGGFVRRVKEELRSGSYAAALHSMTLVDPSPWLTQDQYFPLDEHISAIGHRTLATHLAEAMGCATARIR